MTDAAPSPLQNRVFPDGSIRAEPARGSLMGNRGILHDHRTKALHPKTRWTHKAWISCVTTFKGRQREIMAERRYTELFFLDEVTAMAAGHRPCFECRRDDATAFATAWQTGFALPAPPKAKEMDALLHAQRLEGRQKRVHAIAWGELPVGAVVHVDPDVGPFESGSFLAKGDTGALVWSAAGYTPVPTDYNLAGHDRCACLTPPAMLTVLRSGYRPLWHPSAAQAPTKP
ncbi:MAG: hypothetical protein AAFO73_06920 [Pseudomonadota bacterium]